MPRGWSLAPYDPNALFDAFPCLQLKDGYRLAAYQFHEGGNGNGFVFVTPADKGLPDPDQEMEFFWPSSGAPVLSPGGTPLPEWAHADVARFLEGDGSPLSYFQASIFMRELQEMGAEWHGCSWATHEVLTSAGRIPRLKWEWNERRPRDWRPLVGQNPDGLRQVVFYSYSGLGQERILRHTDTFVEGYQFNSVETAIALAGGGYVF